MRPGGTGAGGIYRCLAAMLPTHALDYDLPVELIATKPAEPRDSARLLVVSRSDASRLDLHRVLDLPELLRSGDTIVVNDSRVVPARLVGSRRGSGGKVEGLFLAADAPDQWTVMLAANRALKAGDVIDVRRPQGAASELSLTLVERKGQAWRVRAAPAPASAFAALARVGLTPLPPYIRAARKRAGVAAPDDDFDRARYQTVYGRKTAAHPQLASVAAPTAGLHFTPELLKALADQRVECAAISLGVGAGTFKPVEADFVEEHEMHEEWLRVTAAAQRRLAAARSAGGRIIAIGTTAARALESIPALPTEEAAAIQDIIKATRLLITPGHVWRNVDALLTNFHLPRSTLLAMTAAMLPEGIERLLAIYREAIRLRLRFYSYGDAMLILP